MQKICHITFIFLAFIFAFKSLSFLVTSTKACTCYAIDINENEPVEKGEKEDVKEKDIFEEGKLTDTSSLPIPNYLAAHFFQKHSENRHFPPYFEVYSPPPEFH